MALIGRQLTSGNYLKLDNISSQFNSSTRTFNLTTAGQPFYPGSVFSVLISVGGAIQEPATSYTIDQATITFASAPTTGSAFFGIVLGLALNIGVPADGTVTGSKLSLPFNYNSGLLYLDTTNNRVGILSTSPTVALDVVGNSRVSGITNLNGLSVTGIATLSGTTIFNPGTVLVGTATSTGTASQKLQVTGGAYVSGNLGIGTTNPTSALTVVGNVLVSGVSTLGITTATNLTAQQLNISGITTVGFLTSTNISVSGIVTSNEYYIGTTKVISSARQLQNIASLDATTTATIETAIQQAPNNFISLNISGISTLQSTTLIGGGTSTGTAGQVLQVTGISSGAYIGGSVGIGTTNPTSKLHVVGDTRIAGVVTATTFVGALTGTATSTTNIPNLTGAITSNNTTTSLGSFTSSQLATALTDKTGIGSAVFSTSPVLVTPSLGIATATSIVVSSGSTFTNGPVLIGTATSTGTANQKLQVTGGAYVSGSLGIGTASPAEKLHIHSDLAVIRLSGSAASQTPFNIRQGIVGTSNAGFSIYDVNNSATRFAIDPSGNIGIGISTPLTKLDVRGVITAGTDAPNGSEMIRGYYSGGGSLNVIGSEHSSGGLVLGYSVKPSTSASSAFFSSTGISISRGAYTIAGNEHKWYVGAVQTVAENSSVTMSEVMRITSLGRFGLGTSAPGARLSVVSADNLAATTIADFSSSNGTSAIQLGYNRITQVNSMPASAYLQLGVSNKTDAIHVDGTGNVGIGTNSPSSVLDVASSNSGITLTNTGASNKKWRLGGSSAGSFVITETGVADRLTIDSSGRFGIGTTSPGVILECAGTGSQEVALTSNTSGNARYSMNLPGVVYNWIETERSTLAMKFAIANAERARIDSSGRLLVGTSTASSAGVYAQYGLIKTQGNSAASGGAAIVNIARGEGAATITSGEDLGAISFTDSAGNEFGTIICAADANAGTDDYPGRLVFSTTADGAASPTERMRITSAGDVTINTGNLVIGTSGKGIDFSANANAAGMTSELLDDYEEGTWTPLISSDGTQPTVTNNANTGNYTKIGNVVYCRLALNINITVAGSGLLNVSLPFTAANFTTNWQHQRTGYYAGSVNTEQIAARFNVANAALYSSIASVDDASVLGTRIFSANFFYLID